jgi:prevent-host-death family protein
MNTWPVQNAKSRFSEFLDACITVGPQLVTKHGAEAAVLVSVAQWRRLQGAAQCAAGAATGSGAAARSSGVLTITFQAF